MQVTQEKRPGSRLGFKIVVEADRVKRSYEKTLRQLERNIQIPGFRKGKAPRNLVVRQVGRERVMASAIDDLIQEAIQEVLQEAQVTPIGQFELDEEVKQLLERFNPEAEFSFSGYVEVYPEARVGQYKGLTVTATRVDVKPEEVDRLIEKLRDQRATLLPVEDRPAQLGDVVVLDFQARDAEGSLLEELAAQDLQLELEEENFIPGFVAGVVGMQLDETKEITATLPEDYFRKELAGKTVTFTVCLKEIKTKELPELDDAFVQEVSNFQTVAELREHLKKRLEQDALRQSEENLETAILNAILATTEVDLPESLVEQEITQLLAQDLQSLQQQARVAPGEIRKLLAQLPPETLNQLRERHRAEAIDRLRRAFALSAIVRQEQIAVGPTELEVEMEAVMKAYAQQGHKLDRERTRQVIYENLLTRKVMAWLKSQTTVNWVDSEGNPTEAPPLPVGAKGEDFEEKAGSVLAAASLEASTAPAEAVAEPPSGVATETATVAAPESEPASASGESLDREAESAVQDKPKSGRKGKKVK